MGIYVDIETTVNLNAKDGTDVDAGAIVKFESKFPIGVNSVEIERVVYRSRVLFDAGKRDVEVENFDRYQTIYLTDNDFVSLTPYALNEKVAEELNNELGFTGVTKAFVVVTGSTA